MKQTLIKKLAVGLAVAALATGLTEARGATCPSDATEASADLFLTAYRADGTTPIAGDDTLSPCETIVIAATLVYLPVGPGGTVAAYHGGTLTVALPDGPHDLTSEGGIPVLGPAECDGVPAVTRQWNYTVTLADATRGFLIIEAAYAGGMALIGDGLAGLSRGLVLGFAVEETCPDSACAYCDAADGQCKVDYTGCVIEELCPCAGPASGGTWKNHKQYVACVTNAAEQFVQDGLITAAESQAVINEATQSACGRKNKS